MTNTDPTGADPTGTGRTGTDPAGTDPAGTDSVRPTVRAVPTSASYSITVRVLADTDPAVVGRLATAVGAAGGVVTAIDVADSRQDRLVVDVTCSATDGTHAEEIVAALRSVDGVTVHKVSDRTFLLHLGGKIRVESRVPLKTRDDLSMAYTPGVGRVALALAANPDDVRRLTVKGNRRLDRRHQVSTVVARVVSSSRSASAHQE